MRARIRVNHDGAGEHMPGKVKSLAAELVEILPPPQVIVVGLCAFGRLPGNRLFFLRGERNAQSLADAAGDLVLDLENILEFAVIPFSPNRMAGLGLHELGGNAQPVAGRRKLPLSTQAALSSRPTWGPVIGFAAVNQHGCPREDLQLFDLRQLRNDVFGHSVAEILVILCCRSDFRSKAPPPISPLRELPPASRRPPEPLRFAR